VSRKNIGKYFTGVTVYLAEHNMVASNKVLQYSIIVIIYMLEFFNLDNAEEILKTVPTSKLPFFKNSSSS
jgi:hypothetical protein